MTYQGPIRCSYCRCEKRAAEPGHEQDPPSDGICEPCWHTFRAANGLKPAPYPSTEGASA